MPRKFKTAEQRRLERNQLVRDEIAKGLAVYKHENRLNNVELGERLGLGRSSAEKLLNGREITQTGDILFQILDMAGLVIGYKKRPLDKEATQ